MPKLQNHTDSIPKKQSSKNEGFTDQLTKNKISKQSKRNKTKPTPKKNKKNNHDDDDDEIDEDEIDEDEIDEDEIDEDEIDEDEIDEDEIDEDEIHTSDENSEVALACLPTKSSVSVEKRSQSKTKKKSIKKNNVQKLNSKQNEGMKPRQIFTGYYDSTGSRMRCTVHDGTLRIPTHAINIVKHAIKSLDEDIYNDVFKPQNDMTPNHYRLLPLESNFSSSKGPQQSSDLPIICLRQPVSVSQVDNPKMIPKGANHDNTYRIRGGGETVDGTNPNIETNNKVGKEPMMNNPLPNPSNGPALPIDSAQKKRKTNALHAAVSYPLPIVQTKPGFQQINLIKTPPPNYMTNKRVFEPTPIVHPPNVTDQTKFKTQKITPTNPAVGRLPQTAPPIGSINPMVSSMPPPSNLLVPMVKKPSNQVQIKSPDAQSTKNKSQNLKSSNNSKANIQNPDSNLLVVPLPKKENTDPLLSGKGELNSMGGVPAVLESVPDFQKPSWYTKANVSSFEKKMLPEWFDLSAPHRTFFAYLDAREKIIDLSLKNNSRYLTASAVRRSIVGDVGSLLRLYNFLESWGFINRNATVCSTSTPASLVALNTHEDVTFVNRRDNGSVSHSYVTKQHWPKARKEKLLDQVIQNSYKNDNESDSDEITIDWEAIGKNMGHEVTVGECQREFISMTFDNEIDINGKKDTETNGTDSSSPIDDRSMEITRILTQNITRDLVQKVPLEVVNSVTNAALQASKKDIHLSQKAALLGIIKSQAAENIFKERETRNHLLVEILEQRMKKIENRLSLLDDMEAMFEAERVTLELERRDLYTSRCRHWLNDGN